MAESEKTQMQEVENENNEASNAENSPESENLPAQTAESNPAVPEQESSAESKENEPDPTSEPGRSVDDLRKELDACQEPEEKLAKTISLMEAALAQSGNPDFKSFWDARKSCLELFKETLPAPVKALHWAKYRELTKEAKRLKDIFEEQSAFAVEQIDIAIQAIEQDIDDFSNLLEKVPSPQFPRVEALKHHLSSYLEKQRELNLLNTHAARINALRKELIRTEMRIRQKNKFFQRLSSAGDHVFPKRKSIIKEISQLFTDDVSEFVKSGQPQSKDRSLHQLREEIKALQSIAKELTLNTQAFTKTRLMLSESWDKLKVLEKERKKEKAQLKETFKANADEVKARIEEFSQAVSENQLSVPELQKKHDDVTRFMRDKQLGREEVKVLKDALAKAYQPVKDRLVEEEKKRREAQLEREQAQQRKIKEIEETIAKLHDQVNATQADVAMKEIAVIEEEVAHLNLADIERDSLLRMLTPLQDQVEEKNMAEALALPDGADKLVRLEEILKTALEKRDLIKDIIEKYRKASGSSGLDFEQSLFYNEQLNLEKDRLEKTLSAIAKLDSNVAKLKKDQG